MVKHTQTIRRKKPTNYLSVFDDFVNLEPKGLITIYDIFLVESVIESSKMSLLFDDVLDNYPFFSWRP